MTQKEANEYQDLEGAEIKNSLDEVNTFVNSKLGTDEFISTEFPINSIVECADRPDFKYSCMRLSYGRFYKNLNGNVYLMTTPLDGEMSYTLTRYYREPIVNDLKMQSVILQVDYL